MAITGCGSESRPTILLQKCFRYLRLTTTGGSDATHPADSVVREILLPFCFLGVFLKGANGIQLVAPYPE